MVFYVYENWQAGPHKAVVHTGECGHCNGGRGRTGTADPKHGKWHGPFKAVDQAQAAQQRLKVKSLKNCRCMVRRNGEGECSNSAFNSSDLFLAQRKRILRDLSAGHDNYYQAATFSGPSLHFHLRTLEATCDRNLDQFAESAYALLCSWGMHRMGPRGSKMRDFVEFYESLKSVWQEAQSLRDKSPRDLNEGDWKLLKSIFISIRCMRSKTSLVGNSKVMAHLLPNLVPPIDRQYTWKFLFPRTQLKNGIELEWENVSHMLKGFFYPVIDADAFHARASEWMAAQNQFKWDTSRLKIVDNIVVGLVQLDRKLIAQTRARK